MLATRGGDHDKDHQLTDVLLGGCGESKEDATQGELMMGQQASTTTTQTTKEQARSLGWIQAGFIVFGFAAPAALVGVPFSIGVTGYALGMAAVVVTTVASVGGALMLLEIAMANPQCKNLPELGLVSMGPFGEKFALVCQMTNFVGFMPVALLINALGLQGIVGAKADSCVDLYILAISLVCFASTQVRTLVNTQLLAFISLGSVVVAALLQLGVVFTHENPDKQPLQAIGHPDWLDSRAELFRTLLGLTTTSWAFVPSFLTVELSSAMPQPRQFRRSLFMAAGLTWLLFAVVGVSVVVEWGWDVPDPVYAIAAWPASGAIPRLMQALLLAANLVSYALDSVPLARYCQRVWLPGFKDDWSLRSIGIYGLISLPTFLFALVASVSVGNLLSLLAFVTALTVPWVTQILPPLFYMSFRSKPVLAVQHDGGDGGAAPRVPLSRGERAAAFTVLTIGVVNFLVCAAAAIGKVAIKELRGPTVIGCGSWTLFSDANKF